MKIKRFVAADMRTALKQVKAEHGPDAVILSNRRTAEGIEIVAASNYDEDLVMRALENASAEPAAAPTPAPPPQATPDRARFPLPEAAPAAVPAIAALADAAFTARAPADFSPAQLLADNAGERATPARASLPSPALSVVPAPPVPAQASDGQLAEMREELAQMRQMIEREMDRLTDERLRGSPVRRQAMELMEDYGFDAGITRDIVLQIPADTEPHRCRGLMLGLVSRRLPICPVDPLEEGGVIALVGPTGAGKTTTIAKLAARFVAKHGPRDIALVTTDTARIGGREQLHGYGRQLGVAVHEADSDAGLIQLLQRLQDYRLILVDTAGMGQRDRALANQLNWLRAARQVRSLLVLPANSHYADLDEVVRRFQGANPQGVVLTKLDESGRLGSALSVVVDHQLPLTWITDGQHVPEDLHRANAPGLVLRLEDLRRAADKPHIPESDHAVA